MRDGVGEYAVVTDAEVDSMLYEHKGDAREAIRSLLHDLAVLASDYEADVSHAYVRGAVPRTVLKWRV